MTRTLATIAPHEEQTTIERLPDGDNESFQQQWRHDGNNENNRNGHQENNGHEAAERLANPFGADFPTIHGREDDEIFQNGLFTTSSSSWGDYNQVRDQWNDPSLSNGASNGHLYSQEESHDVDNKDEPEVMRLQDHEVPSLEITSVASILSSSSSSSSSSSMKEEYPEHPRIRIKEISLTVNNGETVYKKINEEDEDEEEEQQEPTLLQVEDVVKLDETAPSKPPTILEEEYDEDEVVKVEESVPTNPTEAAALPVDDDVVKVVVLEEEDETETPPSNSVATQVSPTIIIIDDDNDDDEEEEEEEEPSPGPKNMDIHDETLEVPTTIPTTSMTPTTTMSIDHTSLEKEEEVAKLVPNETMPSMLFDPIPPGVTPSERLVRQSLQQDDDDDDEEDDQSHGTVAVDEKQTAQLTTAATATASVNKKKQQSPVKAKTRSSSVQQKKIEKDATVSLPSNYESSSVSFVSRDELCQETIVASATTASMVAMFGLGVQPALGLSFGAVATFAAFLDGPVGAFVRKTSNGAAILAILLCKNFCITLEHGKNNAKQSVSQNDTLLEQTVSSTTALEEKEVAEQNTRIPVAELASNSSMQTEGQRTEGMDLVTESEPDTTQTMSVEPKTSFATVTQSLEVPEEDEEEVVVGEMLLTTEEDDEVHEEEMILTTEEDNEVHEEEMILTTEEDDEVHEEEMILTTEEDEEEETILSNSDLADSSIQVEFPQEKPTPLINFFFATVKEPAEDAIAAVAPILRSSHTFLYDISEARTRLLSGSAGRARLFSIRMGQTGTDVTASVENGAAGASNTLALYESTEAQVRLHGWQNSVGCRVAPSMSMPSPSTNPNEDVESTQPAVFVPVQARPRDENNDLARFELSEAHSRLHGWQNSVGSRVATSMPSPSTNPNEYVDSIQPVFVPVQTRPRDEKNDLAGFELSEAHGRLHGWSDSTETTHASSSMMDNAETPSEVETRQFTPQPVSLDLTDRRQTSPSPVMNEVVTRSEVEPQVFTPPVSLDSTDRTHASLSTTTNKDENSAKVESQQFSAPVSFDTSGRRLSTMNTVNPNRPVQVETEQFSAPPAPKAKSYVYRYGSKPGLDNEAFINPNQQQRQVQQQAQVQVETQQFSAPPTPKAKSYVYRYGSKPRLDSEAFINPNQQQQRQVPQQRQKPASRIELDARKRTQSGSQLGRWTSVVRPTTYMELDKRSEENLSPIERMALERARAAKLEHTGEVQQGQQQGQDHQQQEEQQQQQPTSINPLTSDQSFSKRYVWTPHRLAPNHYQGSRYDVR